MTILNKKNMKKILLLLAFLPCLLFGQKISELTEVTEIADDDLILIRQDDSGSNRAIRAGFIVPQSTFDSITAEIADSLTNYYNIVEIQDLLGDSVDLLRGEISDSLSNFTSDTVQYSFFADTANLAPLYLPLAGGTVTGDLTTQGVTIVNKIQKEGSIHHEIVMEEERQYNFRFTTFWEDRYEAGKPSDQIIINQKELLQYVSLPDEFSFDYFRLGRERESDASSGSVVDFYDDYVLFRVIGKHDTVDKPIYKQEAIPDSGLVTRGTLNKYLPLTGGSLSGNLDVNGNISVDTIKEFKNYVAKFHRVDSVNTSNTNFNAVKWDTFVSDESVGNWTLTTDSTGIYPPVDGIYQFMGCIHAKNNGGINVEAVICSYPYVGTDTARCGQTQWTFDKSDGEHDQKTFTGTIRMTTSTPFKLDVSVGDVSVDVATNSCLPKHVAFSVSFIKISD